MSFAIIVMLLIISWFLFEINSNLIILGENVNDYVDYLAETDLEEEVDSPV
jgi:hypothetical protein